MNNRLIIITGTYARPLQLEYFERMCMMTSYIDLDWHWIIAEDAVETNQRLWLMANDVNKHLTHIAVGPTRDWGNTQRNAALELIRDQRMKGIVLFCDDDNLYSPKHWHYASQVESIGVWPVGNLGPAHVEFPERGNSKYTNGFANVKRMIGGWQSRMIPVDAGGFGFNSMMLWDDIGPLSSPLYPATRSGGESEFLHQTLGVYYLQELESINTEGNVCVYHNEPINSKLERMLYGNWDSDNES